MIIRRRCKVRKNVNEIKAQEINCPIIPNVVYGISVDYETQENYDFPRYTPNYFRYVDPDAPFYPSYTKTINDFGNEYAICLQNQLKNGNIILWPTEELFIRMVPSTKDNETITQFKDDIRDRFLAFCLNIEKTYIYYNQGKLTCNNQIVPWAALFNYNTWNCDDDGCNYRFLQAKDFPIEQLDQVVIYSVSVNFASSFDKDAEPLSRFVSPVNFSLILQLLNKTINPSDPRLTKINFYQLIQYSYNLMIFLFSTANKLLNGKCPGIPQQFLDEFFPLKRQLYYYNLYLTWIQSRNGYLGFGGYRVNSSNGDDTNIMIPNKLIIK